MLTSEQLAIALEDQQVSGKQLGAILVARGFVAPTTVAAALATQHGGLLKTEYGFATGLESAPEPPAPAGQPAASEAPALRLSPELVGSPVPAAAQPDAVAVLAVSSSPPAEDHRFAELTRDAVSSSLPAEDHRLAEVTRERDELGAAMAAASAEIERLAAGNRSLAAQLEQLTAERDQARAAPEPEHGGLAARLAQLELLVARVTNRGSTISERLDEVIGEVARLNERLRADETPPPARPPVEVDRATADPWREPDAA